MLSADIYQLHEMIADLREPVSWLPESYYMIDDRILIRAAAEFEGDYARWYPDDIVPCVEKIVLSRS